ncbi:carboxymuconolactone decarboxylase family protein [Novosphingobium album (ex Hu et al. 2023)]|uniref:Carboxymuconolactone decarboxylase family protein n=1 Tax=Novosphingobium album (ex Hu et al. 2023) TaxID=2930093 RepID=A0ABT0B5H4_9SPHN|nr:carboxymuconolactone decarboxylase family protein [Novosphingobium album (ex Hu et al. 2023)]MCJ2180263.1 carboxymuconolactone decarboxylase family protein [Novosphingobium album (ex Hu et al. 2023)]
MLEADPPARIPQVTEAEFTDATRAFLDRWTGGFFKNSDKNPPLLTFAHHPHLAELFSQFNIHLLTTNTVPVKLRQIAIMRTAWVCKAIYMWSSHLNTSLTLGLEPDMFDPVKAGADDPYFTDFERVVVRATDELIADRKIGQETWTALASEWSYQQLLDFMFTVGAYVTVAGVMRSSGIERQPDLLALAERYGAPE